MKKKLKLIIALFTIIGAMCLVGCNQPSTGTNISPAKTYLVPELVFVKGATITGAENKENGYLKGVFIKDRTVTLSDFYISKYEITQSQYKSVMDGQTVTVNGETKTLNAEPSNFTGNSDYYKMDYGIDHKDHPVDSVSWYDAVYYCNALSIKEGLTPCYNIIVNEVDLNSQIVDATVTLKQNANGYRLPTEAEWEFAARGGDTTADDWNYIFSGADKAEETEFKDEKNSGLDSVGWYSYNNKTGITGEEKPSIFDDLSWQGTHKVGAKKPNRLGLYDMSGNVCEWCYDWFNKVETGNVTNPVGPELPENETYPARVLRGGSWLFNADTLTVLSRFSQQPKYYFIPYGFRVVRSCEEKK